jgi:hypothetical protein
MRRFWVWARSLAVVGSVATFWSFVGCTFTVDTSTLSNAKCPDKQKGCLVDNKMTCVGTDDPKYGCSADVCQSCGSLGQQHVAAATCDLIRGNCAVAACEVGYKHCTGDVNLGCETSINSDPNNCGQCQKVCPTGVPNISGQTACIRGTCQPSPCNAGWMDCNTRVDDGCECNMATSKCMGTMCVPM